MTPEQIRDLQAGLGHDCLAFTPELIVCGTIVLLLVLRLFTRVDRLHLGPVALVLTLLALWAAWCQWTQTGCDPRLNLPDTPVALPIFSGLLMYDNFTIFLRLFLLGFAALLIWLSLLTGIPDGEDSADFYCLVLGATLGMAVMASANHLLMVFIGVEMASLPSYALAGFLKGRRQSSEASLKYVVYGGGASGVMLYGISLLAGKFGTAYLPDLAAGFLAAPLLDPILVLGTLFVLIGFGFKLAAVPFHFWCPDVFEGASAEVAGFLSVASKGAAVALAGRFVLTVAGLAGTAPSPETWAKVAPYLGSAIGVLAAITVTFGNLAAYGQTNLKRLLAYSTVAHAGYMMMGLATLNADGVGAVLFYLVAYLFMNLGAFAVVAFLRNRTGSEDLGDFRGLIYRSPLLVITLGVFLLSLLGMPPLAGFTAKFQIFSELFRAGQVYGSPGVDQPTLSVVMYALLVIGGLNTALSLFYYVKVLKVMILEQPLEVVEGGTPPPLRVPAGWAVYATVMAVMIFVVGLAWGPLDHASRVRGVNGFHRLTAPAVAVQPAGLVQEVRR